MKYAMHVRGKNLGKTINDTLAHLFELNENAPKKLTDQDIAAFMKAEFAGVNTVTTQAPEIYRRRRQYNAGVGSFDGLTPKIVSRQYDSSGMIVTDYKKPLTRTDNAAERTEQIRAEYAKLQQELTPAQVEKIIPVADYVTREELVAVVDERLAGTTQQLDENRVKQLIAETTQPSITVVVPERQSITLPSGTYHKKLADVLLAVKAGVPILLVGPAGSGKTHLAKQVAQVLGRKFTFNSMSAGVSESSVLGRTLPDADGKWDYRPSPFVKSFTQGGVHLFDEIDAADPNLLVQINSALANGQLSVPFFDGDPFQQHELNVTMAAANTFGMGADRMYVGRNQLDMATVNRFVEGTIEMDYDRDLEKSLINAYLKEDSNLAGRLLAWGWKTRDGINSAKLRRIMSTRNLENQAKMLLAGKSFEAIQATFYAGWTTDEVRKVTGGY